MARTAEALIAAFADAWNRHDVAGVLSFFESDAKYEDSALGLIKHGHAEIGPFLTGFFDCYPNISFVCHRVLATVDLLSWEWTMSGNYEKVGNTGLPAAGQYISVRGSSFMHFPNGLDGKCRHNTDYWNVATMMKQLESGGVVAA